MKNIFLSLFTITALTLAPSLRAEDSTATPVGQASSEGSNNAKSKTWQNIGIATGAVAIAVTALILVSNNNGHHHHHHHGHSHSH